MTSNWYATDSVCDSQNFDLRFSAGSSIEDSSPQRFVTNGPTEDDVIVISDSSCSSSPVPAAKMRVPRCRYDSTSNVLNVRNKENRKLHFLKISSSSESEKERESDSSWKQSDNKFPKKKPISRTVALNETPTETSLTSNDTLLTSDGASANDKTATNSNIIKYYRDQVDKSKRYINDRSPMLITEQEKNLKLREKYDTEKTNGIIKSSGATYSDSPNVLGRHPTFNTPKQDGTGKVRLTKKDTRKILKNIKYTQVVYDSPREKKEDKVVINESTDIEEDIMHPAISPSYNRKIQPPSDSPDVIDTSLKKDNLQVGLFESPKPHTDVSRVTDSYRPLSEKRKEQVLEWLLKTDASDSQSDSSSNTVPPSNRNGRNSGNSSLERLEQNYETPNNRERINKIRTYEKQKTIVNSDRAVNSFFTGRTTLDEYFKKSKNNSKFCTPDNKPKLLPKVQTNAFKTKDEMDCAGILDKLYGTAWRDKANVLFPTTEPRKTSAQTVNRTVQTERKPVSTNQYRAVDLDSNKSDQVENNIKPNQRRNIQGKQKKMDSFIDDESLSGSDSESVYHTALTNASTSHSTKSVPVPASIKRLQTLWDTDTDDEDDQSSSEPKKLQGRKLSFSDDESSSTSEFEPGDFVPPKYVRNKEVAKRPISSKAPKFESTTAKSMECKTFLASLSNTVPMSQAHPNAKKYRLDYKNNKEELCKKLYELYNEKVFDNKLPRDTPIEWNVRMRGTAGYCYNKKLIKSLTGSIIKSSRIVLATKIVDTPDRLRDTLIHEMCHAASWIIDDISDGHGVFWTRWANKATKTFPELPPIRRCHSYEIKTKFTYRCIECGYSIGRHSKSLDIDKKRCGYCYGKFELLVNKTTKSGTVQVPTPKREPTGFALYVKQNYNSVKKEKSNLKHADVMKLLGQQFSAIKITKKTGTASN
ncbi:uncharacterized protein LOC143898972 isoform X3 [Temnothorax americanus]|uniref:uncharacterized protein LOC143898972 isoform X3 n=1 Tax=Temnothorax americanus TaxID=1964332 RepID=UPI004068B678